MLLVVAAKSLWRDGGRTVLGVLTVALIVILVAMPDAIKRSAIEKPLHYIESSGVDVFVLAEGLDDYVSSSIVSQAELDEIVGAASVQHAQGVVVSFARVEARGRSQSAVIQSFEPGAGYGGPWNLAEGRTVREPGEAVVDSRLAELIGVELGEQVEASGMHYSVVGLSEETSAIGKQLVFITTDDAQRTLTRPGIFTHALVRSASPDAAVESIRSLGLSAYAQDDFYELNRKYWDEQIAPTLDLVVVAVTVPGLMLLLVMFHSSVRQRVHELALRTAQGVRLSYLWAQELLVVLFLAVVGVGLGAAAAMGAIGVANAGSPGLDAAIDQSSIQFAATVILATSLLAVPPALIAMARTDPGVVLKEVTV